MDTIKKKYIFDEKNQNKVAVQIDIAAYKKIEQILEDYALGQLMEDNDSMQKMSVSEARVAYSQLKKSNSGGSTD
ncbi:hypothetical protein KUV50_00075 [Membranicola marinus]|uniref:Uncharacterized protein n=1 Tax=Membranihabitans marinus TaxID=1227546 RepID=A0A953HK52_9BACT|nr:hypothetical protein [Membranihabitans marinus]MBY5956509.1 hypothetical protein [Membranihabitans marinus]